MLKAFPNVSAMMNCENGDQLQSMEEMLKADVEIEIGVELGRLLVHEVIRIACLKIYSKEPINSLLYAPQ